VAIDFDAASESERTGTTDPHTWTHTPTGTPRAIIVAAVHGTSTTDHVQTVSYGGVAMTRIVRATDAATELGASELWFLGTGIPTGAQTVSANLASGTTDDIHFVCMSFIAARDCEVIDFDSINGDVADPSVTLQRGTRSCWSVAALYGGNSAPSAFTPNANCTTVHDFDLGNFYSEVIRSTSSGTGDFVIGGTAVSDDVAYAALAFAEGGAIAGTSAGVASSAAVLTGAGALAGTSAGVAASTPALTGTGALAGTSAGTSMVEGAGFLVAAAAGLIEGVSTATGILLGDGALAVVVAGAASATGTLGGDGALAGAAAGVATPTAALTGAGELVGATTGTAAGAAELLGVGALAGTAVGVADSTADLTQNAEGAMEGAAVGASSTTGTLLGDGALAGVAAGTASVTGTGTRFIVALGGPPSATLTPQSTSASTRPSTATAGVAVTPVTAAYRRSSSTTG
jgi:hypothetical protein